MSRNRRDRRKSRGQVFFITARARKGLPFVTRESVNRILLGIFARAQGFYPVVICAYVVMGNHYHFILTGQSCHISPFMNYIQGEIAKAIQKLIPGVYEGCFWEKRFKEQVLHTAEVILDKMAYLYLNPVKSRLVRKVKDYPGLNSYRFLEHGRFTILSKWIPTKNLKPLPDFYSSKQDLEITKQLLSIAPTTEQLSIDPFCWLKNFGNELTEEAARQRIIGLVEQTEKEMTGPVVGAKALTHRRLRKHHKPKSKNRTPYLICYDKALRLSEILSYRQFCQTCRDAWEKIKRGIAVAWPKGAYRPRMRWGPIPAT